MGADEAPTSSAPTPDAPEEEMSMMELLLEESGFMPGNFQRGALVEGTVVRKDKNQLTLDIGAKQEAVVPASDLMRLPSEVVDKLKVGDTVRGVIMRPEGEIVISLNHLTVDDWDKAKALEESGEILELPIVGTNKGGILVQLGNLQGFIPRSHVAQGADDGDGSARMGMVIPVKVIEVNQRKAAGSFVSERQALREWRSAKKGRLWTRCRKARRVRGRSARSPTSALSWTWVVPTV